MTERREYLKKATSTVVAVRLDLETDGFTYEKWGGTQTCKPGDWLVDNDGDVYTVDAAVFARTYRPVSPGLWRKVTPVWHGRLRHEGRLLRGHVRAGTLTDPEPSFVRFPVGAELPPRRRPRTDRSRRGAFLTRVPELGQALSASADQYRYHSGLYGPSLGTLMYSAWASVSSVNRTSSLSRCRRATFSSRCLARR